MEFSNIQKGNKFNLPYTKHDNKSDILHRSNGQIIFSTNCQKSVKKNNNMKNTTARDLHIDGYLRS